jgi:FKBP12-rapamycin complex-associated protein
MVHNLHMILDSDSAPVEIRQRLLGVIEFMERKGVPLNSPLVDLARFAYKCNSLSKALRFTELQYLARPTRKTIKDMVDLSAEMLTPDSGMGILAHAQAVYGIESEPDWLERLGSWDLALAAHEKEPLDKEEGALGRLRCLSAIRDWEGAYSVVKHAWPRSKAKAELSVYALDAAWGTSDFGSFPEYLAYLPASSPDCPFYNAILAVHYNDWQSAQVHLASCRTHLDTALQPSLKDSYTRAYPLLVRAQMLAELEEAIRYKQLDGNPDAQHIIEKGFEDRLQVLSPTPETFENIMRIHGLVIPPRDDVKARSQLADIARHHGRSALANAILKGLIHSSLTSSGSAVLKGPPEAIFSKIRLLHVDQPAEAVRQLRHFAQSLPGSSTDKGRKRLKGRALRRLGDWCSNSGEQWHANVDWEVIGFYQASSDADPSWYKGVSRAYFSLLFSSLNSFRLPGDSAGCPCC